MFIKTLSVTALNNYIKKMMDIDFILSNVQVEGEISNLKIHSSGHIYFSLKDDNAKINCIMFKSDSNFLNFTPENGMRIIAKGRVSIYEKDGVYQLYCREMQQEGIGNLYIEFEKLKSKLLKEGYFDEKHKKKIPEFPKRIGIVTSPTGAAIKDIINVSTRRNPSVDIIISPCLVQGENAPKSIIKAISDLEKIKDVDTIIVARGGGSIEELWAFNDEELCKKIFKCSKPLISGVGHETDYTIIDFVSDLRAPTPSAAAEIAVPDLNVQLEKLLDIRKRLEESIIVRLEKCKAKVDSMHYEVEIKNPKNYIVNQYLKIDNIVNKLESNIKGKIKLEKANLTQKILLLDAHNPLNVLKKGYSIIENSENKVVINKEMLINSEYVHIRMKEERIKATIEVLEES